MKTSKLDFLLDIYRENRLSHVYLLETDNSIYCLSDLKQLIKKMNCSGEFLEKCDKCNLCNLIDNNYLPSLQIIESDTSTIKKEQVIELKNNFSTLPIFTKENIYIINGAEKLTGASANTMLKFIEEPPENVLGFLITSNINSVLPTIKSRCETIKVYYDEKEINTNSIRCEYKNIYDIAVTYINKLEVEKKDSIMYNRNVVLNCLEEREEIELLFKIILTIYEHIYKVKIGKCNTELNEVSFLLNLSLNDLIKRIDLITTILGDIKSNVNKELLLDFFVIEMSGIDGK